MTRYASQDVDVPKRLTVRQALKHAAVQEERGEYAAAILSLERAIHLGGDRYSCYLRQSTLYRHNRQYREALSTAKLAVETRPDQVPARELLIRALMDCRDFETVVDECRDLLSRSPTNISARDALGAAFLGMGDTDGAYEVACDLVEMDPRNSSFRMTRAFLAQHVMDTMTAVSDLEWIVKTSSDTDLGRQAREALAMIDGTQLQLIFTLAIEDPTFRAALQQDPDSALDNKGFALSEFGFGALGENLLPALTRVPWPNRPVRYN